MTFAAGHAGTSASSQRQHQRGLLAGGMGHDMRNSVMPMLLHLDLLKMAADAGQPLAGLDTRRVVENLQRLANGLLLRCTESDTAPAASPMHLHVWWDEVGELIRSTLPRSCELTVEISPSLPRVMAQPAVLAQVMLHLMVNVHLALDAGSACSVSLAAVRTRRGVSLSVQDAAARTAPPAGRDAFRLAADWGMALARTLLQRAGGDISGHSISGYGSDVSIHLLVAPASAEDQSHPTPRAPRTHSTAPKQKSGAAPDTARPTAPSALRVLCIDDNAALTAALALRLGMDARFTLLPPMHSLDDSIARIAALAPSVVLLDLNLPGTERPLGVIRALRDSGAATRVLVLTGNPSTEAVSATREAGAHGFITKGVSPERLMAAIVRAGDGEFVLELDD